MNILSQNKKYIGGISYTLLNYNTYLSKVIQTVF